ncbi:hypothetical protein [Streptomyces sp. NPDC101181]|uniref:hypothetical protein n=1 Tax=Streptomyces sp. NPDC101181 TaxID=3366125 RepID=UPI00382ED038
MTGTHLVAAQRRPPSLSAAGILSAVTLLGALAPVAAVLLLLEDGQSGPLLEQGHIDRSRAGLLCALTACWTLWWLARTATEFTAPRAAQAVDHAARRSVLTAIARLSDSSRLSPDDQVLRDAVHAAAGVAVRWEPKLSTAIAPATRLVHTALVQCGVCLAVASADALAGGLCAGAVVLCGLARSWQHAPARADFGRAQWLALARRTRRRDLTARVLALGTALTAYLSVGTRPGLEVGGVLAAVLLYGTAATPLNTTALRHGVTALRRVRRLVALAARPPVDRRAAVRMSVRALADGGLRVRLVQTDDSGGVPRAHVTEVRLAPGRHVRLTTARNSADVLNDLLGAGGRPEPGRTTGDTVPVLLVPPDPLSLGFASLADNVTLGSTPVGLAQPPPDNVARLAAGLSHGWQTVLSGQFSQGQELDTAGWSEVTAARVAVRLPVGTVLVCLSADPDPALARVLEKGRATGACVLQLEHGSLAGVERETA